MADGRTILLEFVVSGLLWPLHAVEWIFLALRALTVIPLVLFVQGFLVLRAAMPTRAIDFEFAVLSIGMSLSLTVLTGLALHLFGAMSVLGWVIASGSVCVGALHWSGHSGAGAAATGIRLPAFLKTRATTMCLAIVGTLLTGSIALARYGAVNQRQFTYTDLWIRPSDGRNLSLVTVGVKNKEQTPANYVLELLANGKMLSRWPRFSLADEEERVQQIPISTPLEPEDRIEARLYKTDAPDRLYRRVWLSNTATE